MAKSGVSERSWITLPEAARRSGLSESTLRRWVRAEKIPSRIKTEGSTGRRVVVLDAVLDLRDATLANGKAPHAVTNGKTTNGTKRTRTPTKAAPAPAKPAKPRATEASASEPASRRSTKARSKPRADTTTEATDAWRATIERLARQSERAGRLEAEVAALRNELDAARAELATVHAQMAAMSAIETERDDALENAARLQTELEQRTDAAVRAEEDSAERALSEWARAEAIERANAAALKVEQLTLELREARAAALLRDRAESDADEQRRQNETLRADMTSLTTDILRREQHIAELEADITVLEEAAVSLKAGLEDTAQRLARSVEAENAAAARIEALETELETARRDGAARAAALQEELGETQKLATARVGELEVELTALRGYAAARSRRLHIVRRLAAWVAALLLLGGLLVHQLGTMSFEIHGGRTTISSTASGSRAEVIHADGRTETFTGSTAATERWLDDRTETLRAEDPDAPVARTATIVGAWAALTGGLIGALLVAVAALGALRRRSLR